MGKLSSNPEILDSDEIYTDGTYVAKCHECFVGNTKGCIVVFGNTLYVQPFKEKFSNTKMRIKSIKVTRAPITCVTTVDKFVVVGAASGFLVFLDSTLKLCFYLSRRIRSPITSVSFNVDRQYCRKLLHEGGYLSTVQTQDDLFIAEWEDQDLSDEYERLLKDKHQFIDKELIAAFPEKDFLLSTGDGMVYIVNPIKNEYVPLFSPADSNVAAIEAHKESPYLLIGYQNGRIVLFNFDLHEDIRSTIIKLEPGEQLSTLKYSFNCHHLVIGTTMGRVWFIHPVLLIDLGVAFRNSSSEIIKFTFSPNSCIMAYYDTENLVYGYTYVPKTQTWFFKGRIHTHYKKINHMLFNDILPYTLYSIGDDRYMVSYNDFTLDGAMIDVDYRERIEQKDKPIYFLHSPHKAPNGLAYFLVADNKHKIKKLNLCNNMCSGVYLGPATNCFYNDPIKKFLYAPRMNDKYAIVMNDRHIGLQKTPFDGNPYKFIACLASSVKLHNFQCGFRGRFIFTHSKESNSVNVWKIDYSAVDNLAKIGGEELQPYYCLMEGGKHGTFFQEMKDLFYYMQILQQGEKHSLPRHVSNEINIAEIPDLIRSCGYYPTEFEIENILTHARYRDFDETGIVYDTITFCDFVKLFLNHKPVNGFTVNQIYGAFDTMTSFAEGYTSPSIGREAFVEAMTLTGEPMGHEQLHLCMKTLMHFQQDKVDYHDYSCLPEDIDFDVFMDQWMGVEVVMKDEEADKDD